VIGEDTDVLALLLYYADIKNKNLYFRSDIQLRAESRPKVYNIHIMKELLGNDLSAQILFVHAYTGCDTTSRIYGIGKRTAFHKLEKESSLQSIANAFLSPNQTCVTIEQLGQKAMCELFSAKVCGSLTSLRHSVLNKKVASAKSFVTPERLPPTESATTYHSLRAYLQVMDQVWTGNATGLDPEIWGWSLAQGQVIPKTMDTPSQLLRMVHCNCTTGCGTARCSCTGYGLPCTSACGPCQTDNIWRKYVGKTNF
jgi:hypothetical protein